MCAYLGFVALRYLVASHAVAVENADFLILLACHVVQALVGLHVTDLSRTHKDLALTALLEHTATPTDWNQIYFPNVCLDFWPEGSESRVCLFPESDCVYGCVCTSPRE